MLTNQTFIHLQRNWRNNVQFKQLLHIPPGQAAFISDTGSAHTVAHVSSPPIAPTHGLHEKPTTVIIQGWKTWHTSKCLQTKGNGRSHEVVGFWVHILSFFFSLFFCVVLRQVLSHIYCWALIHRIFSSALLPLVITVRMHLLMIKCRFCNLCIAVCMLVVYLPILLNFS